MKMTTDTGEMHKASQKLTQLAEEYTSIYTHLLNTSSTMGDAWKDFDNLACVERINGFLEELKAMTIHIEQSAQALDQQTLNYESTVENIVSGVKNWLIKGWKIMTQQVQITLDTEQVLSIATQIENDNNQLKELLENTKQTIDSFSTTWTGRAADETYASYTEFSNKYFQQYYDVLDQYAKFLRTNAAEQYAQTEQTSKAFK